MAVVSRYVLDICNARFNGVDEESEFLMKTSYLLKLSAPAGKRPTSHECSTTSKGYNQDGLPIEGTLGLGLHGMGSAARERVGVGSGDVPLYLLKLHAEVVRFRLALKEGQASLEDG